MLSWRRAPFSMHPASSRPVGARPELALVGVIAAGLLLAACSRGPATLTDVTETADTPVADLADDSATSDADALLTTPGFGPSAVTPAEIELGGVTMSLSLGPPRYMVDQTKLQAADPAQAQQQQKLMGSNAAISGDQ